MQEETWKTEEEFSIEGDAGIEPFPPQDGDWSMFEDFESEPLWKRYHWGDISTYNEVPFCGRGNGKYCGVCVIGSSDIRRVRLRKGEELTLLARFVLLESGFGRGVVI